MIGWRKLLSSARMYTKLTGHCKNIFFKGRLVSALMGNVNKEKLEEKLNKSGSGWNKVRQGIEVSRKLKAFHMNQQSSLGSEIMPLQDPLGRGTKSRDLHKV